MKPVIRRTESRTRRRSRPLSVRPWPEHTEDAALRRASSTCGGTASPSPSSASWFVSRSATRAAPEMAGIPMGSVDGRRCSRSACAHAASCDMSSHSDQIRSGQIGLGLR
uniref:Uncharacterized protein n=1 Tax=Zea mays TaxID=4577 RepID=C0P6S0_MAIZE|nr:unknown [Zea mays]